MALHRFGRLTQAALCLADSGEFRPGASVSKHSPRKDRFDAVRNRADVRWRTDELMKLLRVEN